LLQKKKQQQIIEAAPLSLKHAASQGFNRIGNNNEFKYVKGNVEEVELDLKDNLEGDEVGEVGDFERFEQMNRQRKEKKANVLAQEMSMADGNVD